MIIIRGWGSFINKSIRATKIHFRLVYFLHSPLIQRSHFLVPVISILGANQWHSEQIFFTFIFAQFYWHRYSGNIHTTHSNIQRIRIYLLIITEKHIFSGICYSCSIFSCHFVQSPYSNFIFTHIFKRHHSWDSPYMWSLNCTLYIYCVIGRKTPLSFSFVNDCV